MIKVSGPGFIRITQLDENGEPTCPPVTSTYDVARLTAITRPIEDYLPVFTATRGTVTFSGTLLPACEHVWVFDWDEDGIESTTCQKCDEVYWVLD